MGKADVFKYGLNRPEKYLKHYSSIESLLKCAPAGLEERSNRVKAQYVSRGSSLVEISLEDASPEIWTSLESAEEPFDEEIDMVFQYHGLNGKIIESLVERACWVLWICGFQGTIFMVGPYIKMGNQSIQGRVLGRQVGDYEKDQKQWSR